MPTTTPTPPPYPAYQHAGLPGPGELPEHWEVRRLKNVCRLPYGDSLPDAARLGGAVPVYGSNGQVGRHSSPNTAGECLIIGRKGSFGKVHYSAEPVFAIDTAFFVDRRSTAANIRWLYYLLTSLNLDAVSRDSAVPGLNREEAYKQLVPLPPPAEQAAIVRYLDAADAQLRQRRDALRRLLALRRAERQALIHQTVTQGLRPNAPQRPAGLPYLPAIPAHWEVRRLKHWVGINQTTLSELTDPDFEFRYLEIGAVSAGAITGEPARIRFANAPSRARRIVRNGDTIISTVRTYLKAVWFAENLDDNLICSTGFAVLTPNQETVPKFVSYLVQSNSFTDRVSSESIGVAYPAISESKLSSFPVAVPPPDEQAEIVAYLDGEMGRIEAAMARDRRLAELYDEYRLRLIADAVTGRLDVRQAPPPASLIPDTAQ